MIVQEYLKVRYTCESNWQQHKTRANDLQSAGLCTQQYKQSKQAYHIQLVAIFLHCDNHRQISELCQPCQLHHAPKGLVSWCPRTSCFQSQHPQLSASSNALQCVHGQVDVAELQAGQAFKEG